MNKHSGQPCPYRESACSFGINHGDWYECRGFGMKCPEEKEEDKSGGR